MKYERLKKSVLIHVSIYLLVLIIAGMGYMFLNNKKKELDARKTTLEAQTATLNGQLTALRTKAVDIAEATKIWEKLPEKSKRGTGLDIDTIKPLIDRYSARYHVNVKNLNLSPPVALTGPYETDSAVVMTSGVILSLSSTSDESILAFIDVLLKNLPGYTQVRSLKMARNTALSDDVLLAISKGAQPEIVNGELTFQWSDIKALPPTNTGKAHVN